jgi:hypothetical protein
MEKAPCEPGFLSNGFFTLEYPQLGSCAAVVAADAAIRPDNPMAGNPGVEVPVQDIADRPVGARPAGSFRHLLVSQDFAFGNPADDIENSVGKFGHIFSPLFLPVRLLMNY